MANDTSRKQFEQWYAENAFDFERDPIGSRECDMQWKAWQAGRDSVAQKDETLFSHCKTCKAPDAGLCGQCY